MRDLLVSIRKAFGVILFMCVVLLRTGPVQAQFGESTQYFPHFALGGGWTTVFTIHNPSASAITVQVQMFRTDGTSLLSQSVALAAGGTQNVNITPLAVLTTGWARLTSSGLFSGTELFQFLTGGQLTSEVGVLPSTTGTEFKLFGTVQNGIGARTGIAVANPSATASSVLTVQRFNSVGVLQDTRTITLGPQQQLARFLNEDPYFTNLDNYDGIVDVSATQPVTAVTLRLDGPQIAAVGVITPQSVTALTAGSVTTDMLAAGAVTSTKVAPGQLVKSINSLKDDLTLAAGTNVTIVPSGNTLTIASTGNGAKGDKGDPGVPGPAGPAGSANPDILINTASPYNTAVGKSALQANTIGTSNTAGGYQSLLSNTTGSGNTANGFLSLNSNNTGGSNTASGDRSLFSNTTGLYNTANGATSLYSNSAGHDNTANGFNSLQANTTGFYNTASGSLSLSFNTAGTGNTSSGATSLYSNTNGVDNTANGFHSLGFNTTGGLNTASGSESLKSNTTGNSNTASGYDSLTSNTTGGGNTAIGAYTDVSSGNLSNATAIGFGAIVNASNKIRLGNSLVTVIEGQVAYTYPSDKTKKENFRPVDAEGVLEKIRNLDVTSWNYIGHEPEQFRHYGPMAQDFFAAFGHDDVGRIGTDTTINSGDLSGVLMLAVQALEKRTADLQSENAELKSQLKERVDKLELLIRASGPNFN